jgi:hypothetical protein
MYGLSKQAEVIAASEGSMHGFVEGTQNSMPQKVRI